MEEIELKLEGAAFDEGMPLHLVTASLAEVQAIIDKSALFLLNRERLTPEDRSYYFVNATSLRQGCFLADLNVIVAGAQQILPGFVALGPGAIWQYAKETWNFLEFVFRNSKSGDMPGIEAHDNSTVTVHYGDVSNTYNAPVIQIAKMSVGHYRELLALLRYPGVDNIKFGSKGSPELNIPKEDKDLLENPTHINRDVVEIEGDIYSFNKHSNAGRLEVGESEAIPAGTYPFIIMGSQATTAYIQSMLKAAVRVACLREVHTDPLSTQDILRLHVLDVLA